MKLQCSCGWSQISKTPGALRRAAGRHRSKCEGLLTAAPRREALPTIEKTPEGMKVLETWKSRDGWTWQVLRKNKVPKNAMYASWYCRVVTPHMPDGEYGDVYVAHIKEGTGHHGPALQV